MTVRTRYAPSPTGSLHIGNVRSGLFAYLYARHEKGAFILRIDDTDQERSTKASLEEILDEPELARHGVGRGPARSATISSRAASIAIAMRRAQLLREGKAYPCYCTPEELDAKRKAAEREHRKPGYDGTCRDKPFDPNIELPDRKAGRNYTIRFRSPHEGRDRGRGSHSRARGVRKLGTRRPRHPSLRRRADLQLRTVLDDVDFDITHVVRGDDHLPNTPRQMQMFLRARATSRPRLRICRMVMGPDGGKLSKRHGATSVFAYRDAGLFSRGAC